MIAAHTTDAIRGYHAHVYFDAGTREVAVALRDEIATRFEVELGRVHEQAVGPHGQPMYQLKFGVETLGSLVQWLAMNRSGLNILVHPCTDDEIADHRHRTIWIGTPVAFNEDFIAAYIAGKQAEAS